MPREEQGRRANKLALLVMVNRQGGAGDAPGAPVAYLDEYEALLIAHYEIDLTESAAEIASDGLEPAAFQVLPGSLLGLRA